MLDEQDIEKLAQVFATKAELQEAVSNLATKDDINGLLSAIDAYANKADTYSGNGDAYAQSGSA